jgi:hypothetical protein
MDWPGIFPGLGKKHEAGFSHEREVRFFICDDGIDICTTQPVNVALGTQYFSYSSIL